MTKDGKIIGQHQGIAFYTISQRKGLGQLKIKEKKPYYVIKIDAQNNTLIVGEEKDLYSKECLVKDVNWISGQMPKLPIEIKVKIRYKHPAASAILNRLSPNIYIVKFKNSQRAITPGQSAVFYLKDEVLGGGVITD
jgi:tRNA-specific 2-thiouridylase